MSDDAQTQLDSLKANNAADATAIAALEADLTTPTTPSAGDTLLAAVEPALTSVGLVTVFGADSLVNALTDAGYTVTPPATNIPVSDGSDESTDAPS